MSDIIKEAREALEGVTPGPWEWFNSETDAPYDWEADWQGEGIALRTTWQEHTFVGPLPVFIMDAEPDYIRDNPSNARFIAWAREGVPALIARAEAAEAALDAERAGLLNDPAAVHINMLRGTIAKPTVEQIVHLYGREAFQPMIDAAIAQALEKACVAVSEHANWPEDEHGRTEQVGLFARVINAIRAIAALPADRIETDAAEIAALQARVSALVEALRRWEQSGCPDCGGDCASANPPVSLCIMRETRAAIEAARGE